MLALFWLGEILNRPLILITRINDHIVLDRTWDGEGEQILEATFSAEILIEGKNQILLQVDGDTSATAEVNWFNVTNNDGDIFLEAQRQVSSDSRGFRMCFIPLCYLEIQHW